MKGKRNNKTEGKKVKLQAVLEQTQEKEEPQL